jgi:hypothetical protein
MLGETPLYILGDACIEGAIATAEDVDERHGRMINP